MCYGNFVPSKNDAKLEPINLFICLSLISPVLFITKPAHSAAAVQNCSINKKTKRTRSCQKTSESASNSADQSCIGSGRWAKKSVEDLSCVIINVLSFVVWLFSHHRFVSAVSAIDIPCLQTALENLERDTDYRGYHVKSTSIRLSCFERHALLPRLRFERSLLHSERTTISAKKVRSYLDRMDTNITNACMLRMAMHIFGKHTLHCLPGNLFLYCIIRPCEPCCNTFPVSAPLRY